MTLFYFSDFRAFDLTKAKLAELLCLTLLEYKSLFLLHSENIDGVVTNSTPNKLNLSYDNTTLQSCIELIGNRDLRTFAYRIFTKYPLESYFHSQYEENLIEKEHFVDIDGIQLNAINQMIVYEHGGVLFTLGFHEQLRKNTLDIIDSDQRRYSLINLFGLPENTDFISTLIKNSIVESLGNYQKLLVLIGDNAYSNRFKKGFHSISLSMQEVVIEHFQRAKDRNGATPFFPDDELVKDVTPEKSHFSLFELRVFKPVAYRVYFSEKDGRVLLALLEKKPKKKKQSAHINSAISIIEELLILA